MRVRNNCIHLSLIEAELRVFERRGIPPRHLVTSRVFDQFAATHPHASDQQHERQRSALVVRERDRLVGVRDAAYAARGIVAVRAALAARVGGQNEVAGGVRLVARGAGVGVREAGLIAWAVVGESPKVI